MKSTAPTFMPSAQSVKHQIESTMHNLLGPSKNAKLLEAMRYSAMAPSKCVRGCLVVYVADLYDVPRSQSLRYAAAVEYVHAFSLIHDDLPAMDDADMRRGQASCHIKFDEATAILTGNALMAKAFEVIAAEETHQNLEIRCKLITLLSKAIGSEGMIAGQMIDIASEGCSLSFEQLQELQSLKTGELITASILGGAILGGAPRSDCVILQTYGDALGLLFQVTDDLLDCDENVSVLGKPTGQDVAAEKATFLSLLGKEKVTAMAESLYNDAIKALESFGQPGAILQEVASEVLKRSF